MFRSRRLIIIFNMQVAALRSRHAAHLQACERAQHQLQVHYERSKEEKTALLAQVARLQAESDGLRNRFVFESSGLL